MKKGRMNNKVYGWRRPFLLNLVFLNLNLPRCALSIHDKLIRIGVAHLTSTKQCDIRSFFVSSERSLPDLNDTLWCVLVVIHNFELDFTFKDIEVSYLLFSFLHCNFILIFYIFFDNITLCTKCDIIKYVTPCLYHTFRWNGGCDIIKVRV